jgi:OFA family oxalate/formate antiporter-like MFS transporter
VVANTVKWFPDKKGVATGLVVAGAGVGAMVSAPIISSIVYGYGVAQALHALGLTYVLVIATASMFVMLPPDNYQSDLKVSANRMSVSHGGTDKTWKEMVQDPLFYVLWTMYALGASSGLMIIGHAVSIGQELSNLSVAMGALSVSIISLANTCGRVSWGYLSDKIGCYQALMGVYLLSTVSMSLLVYSQSVYSFILAISIVGLCYGGVVTIFPTVTADLFGSKHLGLNFGILFTAFAAAALIGPRLAAQCKEITGTYSLAFTIGIVFGFCGIATTLLMIWRNKIRYQQQLTAQAES